MNTPFLFLIFNRPDLTGQVFAEIRKARPSRLFIAADGPRPDRPEEPALCSASREIVSKIDWPCKIQRLYRDTNLGCRRAVTEAIDWFFEHVEEGIILEDDCLPDPSFFPYCGELLEHYRDDERMMVISGNNFQDGRKRGQGSFYFSIFPHIWGWATWRRAWRYNDPLLTTWQEFRDSEGLKNYFHLEYQQQYWASCFEGVLNGQIDTWDFGWIFSCWAQSGLSILPNQNLVKNIGFDDRATHTNDPEAMHLQSPTLPISLPLDYPRLVVRDLIADDFTMHHLFGVRSPIQLSLKQRAISKFHRGMRRLKSLSQ